LKVAVGVKTQPVEIARQIEDWLNLKTLVGNTKYTNSDKSRAG
jgi:hypothetical protein